MRSTASGQDPIPRPGSSSSPSHCTWTSHLPQYLLATKLMSARPGADFDDTRTLDRLCGFTTVEEGTEVLTRAFLSTRILPETEYLLGETVEDLNARPAEEPGA